MFSDLKKHGFDLESAMLQTVDHLSRLTLVFAYLLIGGFLLEQKLSVLDCGIS